MLYSSVKINPTIYKVEYFDLITFSYISFLIITIDYEKFCNAANLVDPLKYLI